MAGAEVWKSASLVRAFLEGVRGGIPFAAAQIDVMLRLLAAAGRPLERFLDLGCGDGVLTAAILDRWPQARGTLVDFSEPMLRAARQQLERPGRSLDFVFADLRRREWREPLHGRFDAVVSGFAIHHLTDRRKRELYREIFALLDGGGVFVNVEHVSSASPWIAEIADHQFVDSLYAAYAARGSEKSRAQIAEEFAHRPDKETNILAPIGAQCRWLERIGFVDVDCCFKTFELAVFCGRRPPD